MADSLSRCRVAARPGLAWVAACTATPVCPGLEKAEWLGAVADQQVLGLAVVFEHHPVVLPADAGNLVPAERGARRVLVVAVRPHATGLDGPAHAVRAVAVAGPHAGAQPEAAVVGD